MPGIFVKYDLTALKIKVIEEHKPYWQFLVRLCGIIGGIFVVSGKSLSGFSKNQSELVMCQGLSKSLQCLIHNNSDVDSVLSVLLKV